LRSWRKRCFISHEKAQKSQKDSEIIRRRLTQITQKVFSQLGVLGKGFAQCEHLRKPAAFVRRGILQCPFYEAD